MTRWNPAEEERRRVNSHFDQMVYDKSIQEIDSIFVSFDRSMREGSPSTLSVPDRAYGVKNEIWGVVELGMSLARTSKTGRKIQDYGALVQMRIDALVRRVESEKPSL